MKTVVEWLAFLLFVLPQVLFSGQIPAVQCEVSYDFPLFLKALVPQNKPWPGTSISSFTLILLFDADN